MHDHSHSHCHCHEEEEHSCSCGHSHKEEHEEGLDVKGLVLIGIGAVLFVSSYFVSGIPQYVVLGLAYLLIGFPVLFEAITGLFHGHPFDEEVLMSIATIGAACVGEYREAVAVMLFYRIGEWVQDLAVEKSREQIGEAVLKHPDNVRVLRDGTQEMIAPEDVKIGELILVHVGERIALDGVVTKGESRLDCSALTGESATVAVRAGSEVMAGTMNTVSNLEIRTTKTSEDSATGRLLHSIEEAAEKKPKLERFITRFSRIYTPCVVGAAVLLAIIPILLGQNASTWIHRSLMFLVISCPCALVLSIPLTFYSGLGLLTKHNVLLKGADTLEVLADVKAAVFDKTGTLTDGVFAVQKVSSKSMSEEELLRYAAAVEQNSPHPIAHAILTVCQNPYKAEEIREHAGKGTSGMVNGKQVLVGNEKLLKEYKIEADESSGICVCVGGKVEGFVEVGDKIRSSAQEMVSSLNKSCGFTALLTGDRMEHAKTVADALGISRVYAELLPEEKLSNMEKIREEQGCTLFLGDGINDAPVLKGADIGIAMAEHGTEMAAEAADGLLLSEHLEELSFAKKAASYTMHIAKQNIVLALGIKLVAMILSATGIVTGMWIAVFADVGAALLCILNAIRVFAYKK